MGIELSGRKVAAALAAACALLLVAVVVLAALAAKWHGGSGQDSADQAATSAAERDLTDIGTYDYRTYGRDVAWFNDFADSMSAGPYVANQKALAKAITSSRTVSRAKVTEVMSHQVADGLVDVFALVRAERTFDDASGKPHKAVENDRFYLQMTLVGGKWKIAKLTQLTEVGGAGQAAEGGR